MDKAERKTADLPLAVWPCAQTTSQWQRQGRYLPRSNRHPAKMLPALARQAIEAYSEPGDLVIDPMCGIGTTLVEAIHLDRRAIGVELEPDWAKLARANLAHARTQGAPGRGHVIAGDARDLARLLSRRGLADLLLTSPPYGDATLGDPRAGKGIERARACEGRRVSAADRRRAHGLKGACRYGGAGGCVAALPYGRAGLVLTSPPYACEVGEFDKGAVGTDRPLCVTHTRNYSPDHSNLGHARGQSYLEAMALIYAACARVLRPGGFLVLVTKDMRARGGLETIALCEQAGLRYWQHVIALSATIAGGELLPRPSFWQVLQVRRALARGERTHLSCHEDVLVFRRSAAAAAAAVPQSAAAERERRAA